MRSSTTKLLLSIFSFFLLIELILCQSNGIVQQIRTYSAQYKYSIQPSPVATMVFWWTPDTVNNQIRFAAMGAENAYVAFGFNNNTSPFDHMTNGYAVLGIQNNVTLYYLQAQFPGVGGVAPVPDQSNIKDSMYTVIDGYIFIEFTWVLTDPVKFNLSESQTVIWSTRNSSAGLPALWEHDVRGYFTLNFNNPGPITPVSLCVGCKYGTCVGSSIYFLGNCSCAHSFLPETMCSISSHQFNHTFYSQSKMVIAEMFWTLQNDKLIIDVRKPITPSGSANQWVGIGFSGPQGQMAGTDAVLFPDQNNHVSAFYINKRGFDGLIAPMIEIGDISYSFLPGNTFFGFSRNLTDGKNSIANTHEVYMIAVASTSVPFSSHIVHDLYSNGADSIDLQTGGTLPPKFFWTNMVTHGFLMWLCWAILIPIGFIWARFVKGYPDDKSALWFEGHRTLMSVGFIIVLISAVYAIGQVETHVDNVHSIMGVSVIVGALYQVMSAVMRPHADPSNPSRQRLLFEYTHHTIGRLAILVSWVAIPFGLLRVPGISMTIIYIHVVISVVWLGLYIFLEIRKFIIARKNREYERIHK